MRQIHGKWSRKRCRLPKRLVPASVLYCSRSAGPDRVRSLWRGVATNDFNNPLWRAANEFEIAPGLRRRRCGRGLARDRGPVSRAGRGKRSRARNDRRSRRIDAYGEDPRRPERHADAEARLEDGRRRQGFGRRHQAWRFRRHSLAPHSRGRRRSCRGAGLSACNERDW